MIDNHQHERVGDTYIHPRAKSSNQAGPGCLSKKQLNFLLRPGCGSYSSRAIRQFFTDDLLKECGITRDELRHIRVFPVTVNSAVINHLKKHNLLP